MINLSTKAEEVFRELSEDKAWAVKYSERKFRKGLSELKSRLTRQARLEKKHVLSRIFEAVSPNGNRWLCYYEALYQRDTGLTEVFPMHVCVYRTVGSIGMFRMRSFHDIMGSGQVEEMAVIYTSHFFLRYAERKGLSIDDERLIPLFLSDSIMAWFALSPNNENGARKVDMRIPDGIGRGLMVHTDPPVIEIRTYLGAAQLSKGQKRSVGFLLRLENYDGKNGECNYLDQLMNEEGWVPTSAEDFWRHRHFRSVEDFKHRFHNRMLLLLYRMGFGEKEAIALLQAHVDFLFEAIYPLFLVFQQTRRLDHQLFSEVTFELLERAGLTPACSKEELISWQQEIAEKARKEVERRTGAKVIYEHER